jgi:integrase
MASIQKKGDAYYCQFCHRGKRLTFTVGKVPEAEAHAKAAQVDYLILRIRQGFVEIPPGVDVATFVARDGRLDPLPAPPAPRAITFRDLKEQYLETHRHGAMEETSLKTVEMHLRHVGRTLGERFAVGDLALADLQRHVNGRVRTRYRGRRLSPVTLRKEVASFRAVWNWGVVSGLVQGPFPAKGLVYPKGDEKPPFLTREEIERRLARGGLSAAAASELWDSLYLRADELAGFLAYVEAHATQPWVYPLVCTAAHTGMRRSELLRAEIDDVDLDSAAVTVREKKRSRTKRTTRRVPLSPFLQGVLTAWLATHPAGRRLFCQSARVVRSKTRRSAATPITRDEAHDHLKRTLAGSLWSVLRGYHVLRHSFISACASKGVDQRLLDEWVGHQTDEQRKRYRHLYPSVQQEAIAHVFGLATGTPMPAARAS